MKLPDGLTILLVPGSSGRTHTIRLPARRLRWLARALAGLAILALAFGLSWVYFVLQARKTAELESYVAVLEEENRRIDDLVGTLAEVEAGYERIRGLFGSGAEGSPEELVLPAPGGQRPGGGEGDVDRPTSWPLSARGFVSQPLVEGASGEHPGLDVAVPRGTYIRASGNGQVVEVGEDRVYGRFLVIDHPDGYRTLYAHAAEILVEEGQLVRQNEVLGLTGSSGRSTAPHLHFEISRDGEQIDPLTMLRQP